MSMDQDRRRILSAAATTLLLPLAAGCSARAADTPFASTSWRDAETGLFMRRFAGTAAPPRTAEVSGRAEPVDIDSYFPNDNDPFAVNRSLELGEGGWTLQVIDRGMAGVIPDPAALWPLNMVPFGVAFNGTILDPSGPWYDGGPADPQNAFDRACSGWEYEVTHPQVMELVGVPDILQGHVQPSGMFHYHGYSATLVDPLRTGAGNADGIQLLGYSSDGYPIIDWRLRARDGSAVRLESGWRLRGGARAAQPQTNPALTPTGQHDGLYVQDYDYAPEERRMDEGVLTIALDRRNGLVLGDDLPPLPGFPQRHYAYVMTPRWPMIPRLFAERPDDSFGGIIPLERGGRPGRSRLYDGCGARADAIRGLDGRGRY